MIKIKPSILALMAALSITSIGQAEILKYEAYIDTSRTLADSDALGTAVLCLDTDDSTFDLVINLSGLTAELTVSHLFVGPVNAPGDIVYEIGDYTAYETLGNFYSYEAMDVPFPGEYLPDLLAGNLFLDFHTTGFPNGEVDGQFIRAESDFDALVNLSTRGMVNPGKGKAGLLIGGLVLQKPRTVFFRMVADSLTRFGVQTSLKDTSFEVYKLNSDQLSDADLVGGNDNWKEGGQKFQIMMTGIAPGSDNESALFLPLEAGSFTLNANSEKGAGIALIEIYGATPRNIGESIATAASGGSVSEFSILNAALEATGLSEVLTGPGPFTLFAPTDAAFLSIYSQTELDELLAADADEEADLTTLTGILLAHVVGGNILSEDLTEDVVATFTTLMGNDIDVLLDDGTVTVDNATVIEGGIASANGVIHVIDAVLE